MKTTPGPELIGQFDRNLSSNQHQINLAGARNCITPRAPEARCVAEMRSGSISLLIIKSIRVITPFLTQRLPLLR